MRELKAVMESYPHVLPIKDGRVTSDKVHFNLQNLNLHIKLLMTRLKIKRMMYVKWL